MKYKLRTGSFIHKLRTIKVPVKCALIQASFYTLPGSGIVKPFSRVEKLKLIRKFVFDYFFEQEPYLNRVLRKHPQEMRKFKYRMETSQHISYMKSEQGRRDAENINRLVGKRGSV